MIHQLRLTLRVEKLKYTSNMVVTRPVKLNEGRTGRVGCSHEPPKPRYIAYRRYRMFFKISKIIETALFGDIFE